MNDKTVSQEIFLEVGQDPIGSDAIGNDRKMPMIKLSEQEKIDRIAENFSEILKVLGLNLQDEGIAETPQRVAKMYVREIFRGLDEANRPKVTLFKNNFHYQGMLIERDIDLFSVCEHHLVPFVGRVHIAYFPQGDHIIGLSKLNRIVQYYAQRPQVQERLTKQIADDLMNTLQSNDIAVIVEAVHFCVMMRGVRDRKSSTTTSIFSGKFKKKSIQSQLFSLLQVDKNLKKGRKTKYF